MLGLPQSTEFNKRIPKKKIYENLTVAPSIRKLFAEQIKIIYWRNKLASTTLNVACGKHVSEVEIFELRLNESYLNEEVLRLIDSRLPYHILFLLEYDGKYQAVIAYKEAICSGKPTFKVERYYRTEWVREESLPLHLEGLTMDAVYDNFVRQIAGGRLFNEENITLKEIIEQQKEREQLERRIAVLRAKMKKERQLNRKMELKAYIKKIQLQMEQF